MGEVERLAQRVEETLAGAADELPQGTPDARKLRGRVEAIPADIRRFGRLFPEAQVVVVCASPAPEIVAEAFRAGAADVLLQFLVRAAEGLHVVLSQVDELLSLVRLVVVAAHAVPIEHRLHLAVEAESAGRAEPRLDLLRGLSGRGQPGGRWRFAIPFVTADAGEHFTRHSHEPASHELKRLTVLVQGLDGNGCVGRNTKRR